MVMACTLHGVGRAIVVKWADHIGHTLDKQRVVGWLRFYGKLSTMLSWQAGTALVLYVDASI